MTLVRKLDPIQLDYDEYDKTVTVQTPRYEDHLKRKVLFSQIEDERSSDPQ